MLDIGGGVGGPADLGVRIIRTPALQPPCPNSLPVRPQVLLEIKISGLLQLQSRRLQIAGNFRQDGQWEF